MGGGEVRDGLTPRSGSASSHAAHLTVFKSDFDALVSIDSGSPSVGREITFSQNLCTAPCLVARVVPIFILY